MIPRWGRSPRRDCLWRVWWGRYWWWRASNRSWELALPPWPRRGSHTCFPTPYLNSQFPNVLIRKTKASRGRYRISGSDVDPNLDPLAPYYGRLYIIGFVLFRLVRFIIYSFRIVLLPISFVLYPKNFVLLPICFVLHTKWLFCFEAKQSETNNLFHYFASKIFASVSLFLLRSKKSGTP